MNEQKMIDLVNRIADNDKVAPFQNGFVVLSNEEMVRYTELVIRECIRLCDQVDLVGADECIDNIKEHFEVKK